MIPIRNLDQKRVCDMAEDRKSLTIIKKDCITQIRIEATGVLTVDNIRIPQTKRPNK